MPMTKAQRQRRYLDKLYAKARKADALEAAGRALLDHYIELVNCGDCGFWDPEEEGPVTAMRKALEADQ